MPSMRHTPSRGCYGRLVLRGTSIDPDDHDEESPQEGATAAGRHGNGGRQRRTVTLNFFRRHTNGDVSVPYHHRQWQARESRPMRKVPVWWTKFAERFRKNARFCLTNIPVSICLLFVGLGMSLGPGLHTLLYADPSIMIDKSIKAFKIPNHIVTKRHDAFTTALSELRWSYSHSRGKRDTHAYAEEKQYIDSQQEEQQHYRVWDGKKVVSVPKEKVRSHIKKSVDDFYKKQAERERLNGAQENDTTSRKKRSLPANGRIAGITQAYRRWKMTLIYLAQDEERNMFNRKQLETVHHIERKVMNHSGFSDFCYINYIKQRQDLNLQRYGGCAPLNSLLTYFYPSKTPDGTVHYDGLGSKLDRIDRTLSFAMTRDTFFWYVDDKINTTYRKSRLLRSEVQFGAPLPGKRNMTLFLFIFYFCIAQFCLHSSSIETVTSKSDIYIQGVHIVINLYRYRYAQDNLICILVIQVRTIIIIFTPLL